MDSPFSIDDISSELAEELSAASQTKVPVVTCTVEDVLGPEHIAEYLAAAGDLDTTVKSDAKDLSTLRARHHSVARLLAQGLSESLVAELSGYDKAYLSTLKSNPSMVELVALYRAPGNAAAEAIGEKLRTVGDAALNRILEEIPNMDHQALLGAAKLGADRSGNGPQQKVEHQHQHSIDLTQVQRLAQSARQNNAPRIIDISTVRQALPKLDGPDA